jgi:hypothetical protein
MIRAIVDFALNSRFVVLSMAVLLFIWGIISFHNLPVEAYPDVANTWVQVITQWPGRAAEEVEQQVTIPIEIQMNGIPHLQHVRSASLAGLSVVNLIFDDNSDNDWDRQKALARMSHSGGRGAKISETRRRREIKIRKSSYEPSPADGLGVLGPRVPNFCSGRTQPSPHLACGPISSRYSLPPFQQRRAVTCKLRCT